MLLEDNLAVVSRKWPDLAAVLGGVAPAGEVVASRSGFPTLKAGTPDGKEFYLHSAYDPWAEAVRLTRDFQLLPGEVMVILGVGLGYHVWELGRRYPRAGIIAIDPHPGFFRRAMETLDLKPYLVRENLTLAFHHDILKIGDLIRNRVDAARQPEVKTYVYPPLARLFPAEFADLQQGVFEGLVQTVLGRNTTRHFTGQWTSNFLANLAAAWRSQGVRALAGAFAGVPAVIVSAGPSLNKNLNLLAEIRDRAVTMAAGTAFKPLVRAGVKPDLVVSVDGGEGNAANFHDVDENETGLVFDAVTHPSIPPRFSGPRFVGCGRPSLSLFLDMVLGLDKGLFRLSGYTVALTCLGLALDMGCDPIIFIGQDLALSGGRSHVSGSIYEQMAAYPAREETCFVAGNYEPRVATNVVFLSFLRNIEGELAAVTDGRTFINATEGGARIRGTQIMTLREAIDTYMKKDFAIRARIREIFRRYDPARDYNRMLAKLRNTGRDLVEMAFITGEAGRTARRWLNLYNHGLPAPGPVQKIKKSLAGADCRLRQKWQANLLLQLPLRPVQGDTFTGYTERPENISEQEHDRMMAAQAGTFYEGLKETIERTEIILSEAISNIEKISS